VSRNTALLRVLKDIGVGVAPWLIIVKGHQSNPGVGKGGGCKGMMNLAKDRRWGSAILVSGNRDNYLEYFGGGPSYFRAQIFRPLEHAVGVDAHLERVPVCRTPVSRCKLIHRR